MNQQILNIVYIELKGTIKIIKDNCIIIIFMVFFWEKNLLFIIIHFD